jgi:S-DNA-T family DNA segregation ATPase FtsK/SpoIIIE
LPATGLQQAPLFEQIDALKSAEARDELFEEAARVVKESGRGSVSLLQRRLRIGYNRASRIVDQLEEAGLIGPDQGGSMGRVVYLASEEDQGNAATNRGGSGQARVIGEAEAADNDDDLAFDDAADDEGHPGGARPRVWM